MTMAMDVDAMLAQDHGVNVNRKRHRKPIIVKHITPPPFASTTQRRTMMKPLNTTFTTSSTL